MCPCMKQGNIHRSVNMLSFLVQLDPDLQNIIAVALTFVVSFLVLQLAALSPQLAEYLGQYKVGIVTWLTGVVVQLIQGQLNQIPASWDAVVTVVMRLLVEVAVVLIGFAVLRKNSWVGHSALQ